MLPEETRPVVWRGRIARKPEHEGGEIIGVESGSPASSIDLQPGDRLIAINGQPVHDVIDFQFASADDDLAVIIQRSGHNREIHATGDQMIGLRFAEPTFDGITWCNNKCPFCFVKMNPARARPTLYLKDDDYRLSALYGNFVTLTNLVENDWKRIDEQRLSPLYVSVHAIDPALRSRLLGNPNAPPILEQLDRLASLGISYHTQAVLCPGLNDGPELDALIDAIARRRPRALSLSLVPLGLTGTGKHPPYLRRHTAAEAAAIVDRSKPYRRAFRRETGHTFLFPSDELYFTGGRPLPPGNHYDGYAQFQNGVGMSRSLLDEWRGHRRWLGRRRFTRGATIVTGALAAGLLAPIVDELRRVSGLRLDFIPLENAFFGSIVTVAGLLTGRDIGNALHGRDLADIVVLPRFTLDSRGERFLDDVTPSQLARELGRPIAFVEHARDLLDALGGSDRTVTPCAA